MSEIVIPLALFVLVAVVAVSAFRAWEAVAIAKITHSADPGYRHSRRPVAIYDPFSGIVVLFFSGGAYAAGLVSDPLVTRDLNALSVCALFTSLGMLLAGYLHRRKGAEE